MNKADLIVIGGDAAGMSIASAAKKIRPEWDVVVFEAGNYISYALCGTPYYISGKVENLDDLIVLTPETALSKKGVKVYTNHRVNYIEPNSKSLKVIDTEKNRELSFRYEKLAIATGAKSVIPSIPGIDTDGVFTLHSLDDAKNIKKYIEDNNVKSGVIIGGGFIGMEMAEAFTESGIKTTLIEMLPTLLGIRNRDMLSAVLNEASANNVDVMLNSKVISFESKSGKLVAVHTDDKEVKADIALVATGVHPNTELAKSIGLELGASDAIYVDLQGATSRPGIYAAGDCAQIRDLITGKWIWMPLGTTANKQGHATGYAIAGKIPKFKGIVRSTITKFFDIGIETVGAPVSEVEKMGWNIAETTIKSISCAHYYPGHLPIWINLYCDVKTERILGGQYIGHWQSTKRFDIIVSVVANRMTAEDLANLDIPYTPPIGIVWDPINIAARKLI
ncbi:FAD-dependent oxidoreductase [bacterium]|nr:FAD-dependent oxidoreductase [bacterium]